VDCHPCDGDNWNNQSQASASWVSQALGFLIFPLKRGRDWVEEGE